MMKTHDSKRRRLHACRLCFSFVVLAATTLAGLGCASDPPKRVLTPPPLPTYSGEQYLYSTVGSLANLKAFEPLLVSGYGLVVMPPGTGTGSSDVPTHLRQWLINEMRRKGLGSFSLGTEEMTPRRLLESKDVAVVRVEGLMPPGATRGTTFPILVTALEQTQTTSLENGVLWTTDLSIGGADTSMQFRRPLAEGKGAVYLNPFDEKVTAKEKLAFQRQAVVLAGGTVTKDRPIDLVLNQPSWVFSRMIADRVNERFLHEKATEFFNTAVAKSDMVVRINVPARFAGDPSKLLRLISRMFLRRSQDFEADKARQLGQVLIARQDQAQPICEAWQALGKTALPVIREYYQDKKNYVRLTALEAGAWLEDELAAGELAGLALDTDAATRRKASELLGRLPRSTRATMALRNLLDDVDRDVRIAAYEALAEFGDPAVHRVPLGDRNQFKFFLDVVQSKDPLIYVSQSDLPRLVVFSPNAGFKEYVSVELWDGRFRLEGGDANEQISVFYQSPTSPKGHVQKIAPTVANLAILMGHRTSADRPFEGFDLSYSSIVNAIYNLQKKGDVMAQIWVVKNPLADAVDQYRNRANSTTRPEDEEADDTPALTGPPRTDEGDLVPVIANPGRGEQRPE
jgi:flagellar basal body P-ring protein FlgI